MIFKYIKEGEKSQMITLAFDHPRFIVAAEAIQSISKFLLPAFKTMGDTFAGRAATKTQLTRVNTISNTDSPSAVRSPSVDPIYHSKNSTMTVIMKLNNPEIVLLQDETKIDSRAVIMKADIALKYEATSSFVASQSTSNVTWHADGLQIFRCVLVDEEKTSRSILDPFNIGGTMVTQYKSVEGTVDIQPIRIMCSYHDINFFYSIQRALSQTFAPQQDAQAQTVEASPATKRSNQIGATTNNQKLFFIQYQQEVERNRYNDIINSPHVARGDNFKAQHLLINTAGVRFTLINDLDGVLAPTADVTATRCKVDVTNWSTELGFFIDMKATANYFNQQVSGWEPLIEPWEFTFKTNKIKRERALKTQMLFSSKERLNINLTSPFVQAYLTAQRSWQRLQAEGTADIGISVFDPNAYYVRNETGQKLWFWLPGDDVRALENGDEAVLNVKPKKPEDKSPNRQLDAADSSYSGLVLSFQIHGDYKPCHNFPIDKIGSNIVPLQSADQSAIQRKVLYDIRYRSSSKVVLFRSSVLLQNRTEVALEIKYIEDVESKQQHIEPVTVDSNMSVPLPIDFTDKALVSFRPAGFGFSWSSPVTLQQFSRGGMIKCLEEGGAPYLYTLSEMKTRVDLKYRNQIVYQVHTPLIMENLLPVDASFKLSEANGQVVLQNKIDSLQTFPVHQVSIDRHLYLSIQCQGFQWSAPVLVKEPMVPIEMLDNKGRSLRLLIDYRSTTHSKKMSIFVKYWMVNTTGLRAMYSSNGKAPAAGQGKFEDFQNVDWSKLGNKLQDQYYKEYDNSQEPVMFDFPRSDFFSNKCQVKIADSEWSKGFSPDAMGTVNYIELLDSKQVKGQPIRHYQLAVQISNHSKIEHTKIVTILPRFLLVNRMDSEIILRQQNTNIDLNLRAGEVIPMHWPDATNPQFLLMKRSGGQSWSGSFNVNTISSLCLKIKESDGSITFPQVQIKLDKSGSNIIIFSEEDRSHPPYRIDNTTPHVVSIVQKGVPATMDKIPSGYTLHYSWDEYTKPHVLQVKLDDSEVVSEFSMDKIKKFHSTQLDSDITVESFADGPTRVLKLSPTTNQPRPSVDRDREEIIHNEYIMYMEGIGLSVIDSVPSEILFLVLEKLEFAYTDSDAFKKWGGKIENVQMDNQNPSTPFPVVLHKAASAKDKCFAEFSLVKSNKYERVDFYNYFSVLLQEMNINLEEEFVVRVINYVNKSRGIFASEAVVNNDRTSLLKSDTSKMIYFQLLHLNPILANVSYMGIPGVEQKYNTNLSRSIGVPSRLLANIDHAPLELNGLILENPFDTQSDLLGKIITHYTVQGVAQAYKIMGALDIIGSPINLFSNISTGFYDFFHEPAKGIVKSPSDFGLGIAKGTSSLAKNIVFGVFNTTTKITGSIGSGLSNLSMDEQYLRERQARQMRERPQHIGEGVMLGARDFGMGFFKGITGLVEEPMKGVEQEGSVAGFFKGLGRGVIGTVVKPTVGVIDLATQTTKGLRNTASMFDSKVHRKRPPRYFGPEKVLTVYSREKSAGVQLLYELSGGAYRDEEYIYHLRMSHVRLGKIVLLITNKHIFLRKGEGDYAKIWEENLSDIRKKHVETNAQGVVLRTHDGRAVQIPCSREDSEQVYWGVMGAMDSVV